MPPATITHRPVLVSPVLEALSPRAHGTYLDGTLGGGGHAAGILDRSSPDGRLLGLDRDPEALERAGSTLARFAGRFVLAHGSFAQLRRIARDHGFELFDGILLDLGISSDQLESGERGFSFRHDGPLDMRMDPSTALTAGDLVNELEAGELADILYRFGEERHARRIARSIVAARPITSTRHLAETVSQSVPRGPRGRRSIHPATRTFQALRIVVNGELEALEAALPDAIGQLDAGGRLAVISFHSLEDRIVKRCFRAAAADCVCPPGLPECRCDHRASVRLVTRRPITPDEAELSSNPRARSAKLRVAERLAA